MNKSKNQEAPGPSQWRAYVWLTYYAFKAQVRNPATFVFGFIFPIVFISIFGLIGNSTQKLTIGVPKETHKENPIIQTIEKQDFIKTEENEKQALEAKLKRGKLSGIVEVSYLPKSLPYYKVTIITSQANPQESASVKSLVRGIVDQSNIRLSGIVTTPITLSQEEVSGRQFRYIDFVLPGQIGFSLLSTAVFSTVFGFIFLKKALVFKRMFATPTRGLTILLAQGTSRLISALLQTILILVLGILVFKFYLPNGWITFFELMILSVFGLIAFLGFGLFVAGLAKDENTGPPLVNLITLPQFLLSGVFFSTDNFPTWVQPIANNLPLSYFNVAIRKITIEGDSLISTWPYLLGLFIWSATMYLLAAKTFKWE